MSKSKLEERIAKPNEAKLLSDLAMRSKAHWKYPEWYLEKCRPELTLDNAYIKAWPVYVGEVKGNIVGFYALKKSRQNWLDHFWIEPSYTRKGYGRMLFQLSIEKAKSLRWKTLKILSDPYAEPFYKKMGAVTIGEQKSKYMPDLVLPIFEYRIG